MDSLGRMPPFSSEDHIIKEHAQNVGNEPSIYIHLDQLSWEGGPDPIGESPYSRILVYRDYSQGGMKFSDQIPPLLLNNMHVEESSWNRTMAEINKICAETEERNWKIYFRNLADCFGFWVFSRQKTHFEECLERLSLYIKDQNRILYDRLGLELMDPVDNGYRYIEVVVKYLRFRTTMPILQWGKDFPTNPKLEEWEMEDRF